jgi:hypothetical protein
VAAGGTRGQTDDVRERRISTGAECWRTGRFPTKLGGQHSPGQVVAVARFFVAHVACGLQERGHERNHEQGFVPQLQISVQDGDLKKIKDKQVANLNAIKTLQVSSTQVQQKLDKM